FTFAVTNGEGGWFGTPQFNIIMDEDLVVGVGSLEAENAITLFPNPANQHLNIQFKNPVDGKIEVFVSNVQGQRLRNRTFDAPLQQFQLNTADLSAGVYFLQIMAGEQVFTEKFI